MTRIKSSGAARAALHAVPAAEPRFRRSPGSTSSAGASPRRRNTSARRAAPRTAAGTRRRAPGRRDRESQAAVPTGRTTFCAPSPGSANELIQSAYKLAVPDLQRAIVVVECPGDGVLHTALCRAGLRITWSCSRKGNAMQSQRAGRERAQPARIQAFYVCIGESLQAVAQHRLESITMRDIGMLR